MSSSNTSDQATDPAPSAVATDKERSRRDRKRITDRKSQRHHRERQRAYVRELEETVESLKQTCAQSGGIDTQALVLENDRLRQRCLKLEALVARINSLTTESGGSAAFHTTPPVSNPETEVDVARHVEQETASREHQNLGQNNTTGDSPAASLPDFAFDTHPADAEGSIEEVLTDVDSLLPDTQHPDLQPDTTSNFAVDPFLSSILDGTAISLDILPMSLTTRDPLLWQLYQQAPSPHNTNLNVPAHGQYPITTEAAYQWDRQIQRTIDEARTQHSIGQFPTRTPTLRSVLSPDSSDILGSRLFHWLAAHVSTSLHAFLSIFWVQYLFLRWHVVGTREAYLQLPAFMRPTDLERRMPHAMCIGMIVWPDVRRVLVRDAGLIDPETTGLELMKHLPSAWAPRSHVDGDLIGSVDILGIVERQAEHLETWKLQASFRDKHPEFATCRIAYVDPGQ